VTEEGPFVEPTSMENAQDRKDAIAGDISDIQAQLGQYHSDKTYEEWDAWKRKAKFALTCKLRELRQLKAWIRKESIRRRDGRQYVRDVIQAARRVSEDPAGGQPNLCDELRQALADLDAQGSVDWG
jgi:hypothetical protein